MLSNCLFNPISLIKLGCREHFSIAVAAISSGVSEPISTKFGMVNLLGPESVVAEPEFKIFDRLPWKIGNADFEAISNNERVGICHVFPSK